MYRLTHEIESGHFKDKRGMEIMFPMMDEEDSQVPLWSQQVNLDWRVRDDHPLRRIRAALDLSSVRKKVAHTYGRRGNKGKRAARDVSERRDARTLPRTLLLSHQSDLGAKADLLAGSGLF